MVDLTEMKGAEVQIQGAATLLILLVLIEIIAKKGLVRMIMIKTGVAEIETDTSLVIGIAMNVIATIT